MAGFPLRRHGGHPLPEPFYLGLGGCRIGGAGVALHRDQLLPLLGQTLADSLIGFVVGMIVAIVLAIAFSLSKAVEAGVTLLPGAQIRAVEFAKDVRLRLDFAVSDTGGAQMSTVLVVDGEPRSPKGIGLVGTPTPHGFHQLVDGILHLGAFAPAPGPTLLRLIAGGEDEESPHRINASGTGVPEAD